MDPVLRGILEGVGLASLAILLVYAVIGMWLLWNDKRGKR